RELPFSFSALPGRFGVSVAGLIFLIGGVASAALAGAHHGGAGLAVLVATVVLLALAGYLARTAIARLPWGRLRTANWLVTRPGARPRYLVCAHRDSKSQPIPLLVRAGGIGLGPIAALALLLLCIVSFLGPDSWHLGLAAGLIGLLCAASGLVLILSFVQNDSPGALDNASGVATLLGLAERERENGDVGFLVTDGEELGLAGACAACHQLPPVHGIINVDGVDDGGDFHIVERHGLRRRGLAPQLVAALLMAADGLGVRAQRRAVPVGVMVDHIPLAQAGISAVTLMRGGRDSLLRVHRPEDDASRLSGEGIALAVALISAALAVLRRPAGAA
ncbi:MAG TPA: M28 family peptidase, partial [Longimicrobiales bacterium]